MSEQNTVSVSRTFPVLVIRSGIGVLLVLLLVLLTSCNANPSPENAGPVTGATEYSGTVIDPPLTLTDFTLPASTGETLSLSDLRGRWVLLFFGFTHCPDICPTTLTGYRRVVDALGDEAGQLQVVFVSVDAERDTPDRLRSYVTRFNSSFIGLQGLPETLARIQPEFMMHYEIRREGETYTVDHSTRTYLIDPLGQLRITYAFGTERDVLVNSIRQFMAQTTL